MKSLSKDCTLFCKDLYFVNADTGLMRIFDFFSVRSFFISPNERVAKPRVKIPLLVFMSEIKNDLSLKKSNFLFFFFFFCLKIAII